MLVLKFSFRPKPKHFALDSLASCRAVWQRHFGYVREATGRPVVVGEVGGRYTGRDRAFQLLSRLLESIDNGTPFHLNGSPPFEGTLADRADDDAHARASLGAKRPPSVDAASPDVRGRHQHAGSSGEASMGSHGMGTHGMGTHGMGSHGMAGHAMSCPPLDAI